MPRPRQRGFTWVELVVCLAILLFLMALLLPAVRHTRTPGRRNTCNNNLHNIALALQNYVLSNAGAYPGYLQPLELLEPAISSEGSLLSNRRVTWVVSILPMIERADIYKAYKQGRFSEDAQKNTPSENQALYSTLLVCPSNPPAAKFPPPCSYVVNTGQVDVPAVAGDGSREGYPADWPANGVFFNRFVDGQFNPEGAPVTNMTQEFIAAHDGTSRTFMASERLDAANWAFPPESALDAEAGLGFVWRPSLSNQPPFEPPLPSHRINGPSDALPINNARPSSNHPGGVIAVFCDGHSRFISQELDYGVYCLLMTPNGQACNAPGQARLIRPSRENNYDFLRNESLDANDLD